MNELEEERLNKEGDSLRSDAALRETQPQAPPEPGCLQASPMDRSAVESFSLSRLDPSPADYAPPVHGITAADP